MTEHPSQSGPHVENAEAPSPRASAMTVGYLFQTVGLLFALSACCFWSLSSHFIKADPAAPARWIDRLSGDSLPAALLGIGVVATLIGGFALLGVGIGLQGEKRGSGTVAVILTALLTLIYWGCTVLLLVNGHPWTAAIVPTAFALIATVLLVFAVHAAAVFRKYPPSPDQNVVSDDVLKTMGRRPPDRT